MKMRSTVTVAVLVVSAPFALVACASEPSVVGLWTEVDGTSAEIELHESGKATLTAMGELEIPESCGLTFDQHEVDGSWRNKSGGGVVIEMAAGEVGFYYDYWFGQIRDDKVLVVPCDGEQPAWVFAREGPGGY